MPQILTFSGQHTHTRAKVAFFTDPDNGFDSGGAAITAHEDFGHIIGVQTSKNLGAASGTFSLTVKKSEGMGPRSAMRLWKDPEAVWVLIQFLVNGETTDTMLGMIDVVNEDVSRSGNGERSETYQIVGRCFGKIYETIETYVSLYGAKGIRAAGTYAASGIDELKIGTPSRIIRFLNEAWVKNEGVTDKQWVIPGSLAALYGGSSFGDFLRVFTDIMETKRHGFADATILTAPDQQGARLWDSMQQFSNGVMNELFTDLAPAKNVTDRTGLVPALYLRERPFPVYPGVTAEEEANGKNPYGRSVGADRSAWEALPTARLNPGMVAKRALAKGGASNRYNYWMLSTQVTGSGGFSLPEVITKGIDGVDYGYPRSLPIINTTSLQRYGLRRWEQTSLFLPFFLDTSAAGNDEQNDVIKSILPQEGWIQLAALWTKIIHDWYCIAPWQMTGTLTLTRLAPGIRIGHRIIEERAEGDVEYYVEGVSHSWSYPGAGVTTLTVTRGEYIGENLLKHYYETQSFGRDDSIFQAEVDDAMAETGVPDETAALLDPAVDPTNPKNELVRDKPPEASDTTTDDNAIALANGMVQGPRSSDPLLGDADNLPSSAADLAREAEILTEIDLQLGQQIPVPDNIG